VNHITDGSFFKLEHKIKALLETDHVIHDAIKKTAKVLVSKQQFHEDREKLKAHLAEWNAELDPHEIRECNMASEVAHIAQDSLSEEADSFYSSSITSIMAFEVSEIYIPTSKSTNMSGLSNDTQQHNQRTPEPTFISSDDEIKTLKRQIEGYKTELQKQTQKIDQMQEMLQLVFSKLCNKEDSNNTTQSSDKLQRQLYSQP
jgi:ribosomal protein S17E